MHMKLQKPVCLAQKDFKGSLCAIEMGSEVWPPLQLTAGNSAEVLHSSWKIWIQSAKHKPTAVEDQIRYWSTVD
ncbi:HTH myb-type domain-containing protein [Psidium guajava]|nr:HTH myb-type domain-containing protein [Psidium guajava]